jgi:hypothetical protein
MLAGFILIVIGLFGLVVVTGAILLAQQDTKDIFKVYNK